MTRKQIALTFLILITIFAYISLTSVVVNAQGSCVGVTGSVTPLNDFANIRSSPENLGDRNDVGDLKRGSQLEVTTLVNGWYETCRQEYIGSSVVRFIPRATTPTPLPTPTLTATPTKVTPVPLVELIVFVKVFIKYVDERGNNQSVDSGIFPWRANQPVSCQLFRVDNFPQPTVTRLP